MTPKCLIYSEICHELTAILLCFGLCSGCKTDSGTSQTPPSIWREQKVAGLGKIIAKYQQTNGQLPQSVTGSSGFKQSWRMLLVPYLGYDHINLHGFDYRIHESWDSPHNRQQSSIFTSTYTCPLESTKGDYPYTSYVMLVRSDAENAAIEVGKETNLPNDAILIIESVLCGIELAEPRDIDIESLFKGTSPFGPGKLNSLDPKFVKAIRVDGKVVDIPKNIEKNELRKLLEGGAE